MALALDHCSDLLDQLRRGQLAEDGVRWIGALVWRIVDQSGLDGEVVLTPESGHIAWNVESSLLADSL